MAYPQDLVGKFVDYRVNPGGSPRDMSGRLVNGVLPGQTSPASVAVHDCELPKKPRGKFQIVINRLAQRPRWTFTFLNYEPGYVTTTPLTGAVLTGPMSGCYLCTYKFQGASMVAHIGTYAGPDSKESLAAKRSWMHFVDDVDVTGVYGTSPLDYFRSVSLTSMKGIAGKPSIFGYFSNGAAYAILLFRISADRSALGGNLHKVMEVKKMTMQPWSSIAALRTFKDAIDPKNPSGMKEIRRL